MPTLAQQKAIDDLIDGSVSIDKVHHATRDGLLRNGWINDEGVVTQLGLQHTMHPVREVSIVTLGKAVPYVHQFYKEDTRDVVRRSITIPKGTEVLVTFVNDTKKRRNRTLEGLVMTTEGNMWVRLYLASHMKFSKRLMPDMEAIRGNKTEISNGNS